MEYSRNSGAMHPAAYSREHSTQGVNPLCDRLRLQFGPRFETVVNRSFIWRQELANQARRNGETKVRRPKPSYTVRNPLRSPEPSPEPETQPERAFTTVPNVAQPVTASASAAVAGSGFRSSEPQRRGVTEMSRSSGGQAGVRRSTLETIGDVITGKNYAARTDEKEIRQSGISLGTIFAVVICSLLFILVVYCSMQKSVMSSEVSKLENQVTVLQENALELSMSLEMKDDLRKIESIALNELGMVKKENVQTKFVNNGSADRDVIPARQETAENSGPLSGVRSAFSGLIDYFD